MKPKNRLAGRFLPSRVYARWIWPVRLSLTLLPMIIFLSGSLTLYLSPNRFQSSTTFGYLGPRSNQEVAALLKTSGIAELAIEKLELVKQWGVDQETACKTIAKITETKVDPDSGLIELKVTHAQKEHARNLAAELVSSLDRYEQSLAHANIDHRIHIARISIRDAEDLAEVKRQELQQLLKVRGEPGPNPVTQLDFEELKNDWAQVSRRILDDRLLVEKLVRENAEIGSFVEVHDRAEISMTPVKDADDSLGSVILEALGGGLCCALGIPYLLELAFPRRRRRAAVEIPEAAFDTEPSGVLAEI